MVNVFDTLREKVVLDGKVAVLYSPGFGAGWYTWHSKVELVFDPVVVQMVLDDRREDIEDYCLSKYPDDQPYMGGSDELTIRWVPLGARFRIHEYDGAESVIVEDEEEWLTA